MAERTILITGATGKQGGAAARELLADGRFHVRAMTRKPESEAARELARLGAEVVQGDLDDGRSLRRVLQEAWGVLGVQNTWEAGVEREEEQGKRLATLAREAGITHYVYASVGSAHRRSGVPHFDNKWRIEETVRALGFPTHVIVRPVFFMENFLAPSFVEGFRQGKLVLTLRPDTVLQMIAIADVGKYHARAFLESEALSRREIDVAGDQQTAPETARVLGEAIGRQIEYERIPIDVIRAQSEDYALMLEWFDEVGYDVDIDGLAAEHGIAPTRLSDWARGVRRELGGGGA